MKIMKMKACRMCDNARINENLTDDNDLSYYSVGNTDENHRIFVRSGDGSPLAIVFDEWDDTIKAWKTVAMYYPECCPNCGREINEYW